MNDNGVSTNAVGFENMRAWIDKLEREIEQTRIGEAAQRMRADALKVEVDRLRANHNKGELQ